MSHLLFIWLEHECFASIHARTTSHVYEFARALACTMYVTIIGCNAKKQQAACNQIIPFVHLLNHFVVAAVVAAVATLIRFAWYFKVLYYSKAGSMQWTEVYLCKRFYLLLPKQHAIRRKPILCRNRVLVRLPLFAPTSKVFGSFLCDQISLVLSIDFEQIIKFIPFGKISDGICKIDRENNRNAFDHFTKP